MKKILILAFFTLNVFSLSAIAYEYDIDYMMIFVPRAPGFEMQPIPGYGNYGRNENPYYEDTPLMHAAQSFRPHISVSHGNLEADVWALVEHYGMSYGVFNKEAMQIIPRFNLGYYRDSLFETDLGMGLDIGNYDRTQLFEGLHVNNLDIQGYNGYLDYGALSLRQYFVADMAFSVGYGIDDMYGLILGYSDTLAGIGIDAQAGFSMATLRPYRELNLGRYIPQQIYQDFSLRLSYERASLYGQLSFNQLEGAENGSAFLVGAEYIDTLFDGFININSNAEFRYYDTYYNRALGSERNEMYGPVELLRDRDLSSNYYYPVYNSTYRLENWGLYQAFHLREVADMVFFIDMDVNLLDWLSYSLYADMHLLHSRFKDSYSNIEGIRERYFYNLVRTGLKVMPEDGLTLFLGMTNYDMELRSFFPTFNQLNAFYPRLEVRYALAG